MPHIHEKIDFTASVFIVNGEAVLLRKHEKFNQWLQPGGHVELDEDPAEAAIREAKEETGLDVTLVGVRPSGFDTATFRHVLTPRFMNRHSFKLKPGHEHIDCVYFGMASHRDTMPGDDAGVHEKSAEMRWFTREELGDPQWGLWSETVYYAKAALDALSS